MPTCLMAARPGIGAAPPKNMPAVGGGPRDLHDTPPVGLPSLLLGVMDILSDGVIVTAAAARVLFLNRSAEDAIARRSVSIRSGFLCAGMAQETQRLHALVAACVHGRESSGHLRSGGRVFLTITAVGTSAERPGAACAVIFLRDGARVPGPSQRSIMAYFGLTPAEAKLAHEISRGEGVPRCARRLGTRVTTVRSHLKHIFEKTETKRQAHLVRLLLSCDVGLAERSSEIC